MSAALIAALEKLLSREGDLPASALTASQRRALDELGRRTGAIQISPSGAGSTYRANSRQLVMDHLSALRPHGLADLADVPKRAANIGNTRDSKGRSHRHDRFYLLTKAIGEGVVWRREGVTFDLSKSTEEAGAGAMALSAIDDWSTDGPIWLVENQALFDRTDWFPGSGPATLAYYAGQLPGELLRWLAERPRTPRLVLFADYDGVGLENFARLRAASAGQSEFWLMPGWQELLRRYGNRPLWERTQQAFQSALAQMRSQTPDTAVMLLCEAMSREGLALEHEAIWLAHLAKGKREFPIRS